MCVQYMYSIMFIRAAFCFSPVSCSHCHCRTSTCRTTASLHFTCFVLFLLSQLQGPGAPRLRLYMYLLVAQSGLTLSMSVRIRSLHSTFFLACCATYRKKKLIFPCRYSTAVAAVLNRFLLMTGSGYRVGWLQFHSAVRLFSGSNVNACSETVIVAIPSAWCICVEIQQHPSAPPLFTDMNDVRWRGMGSSFGTYRIYFFLHGCRNSRGFFGKEDRYV